MMSRVALRILTNITRGPDGNSVRNFFLVAEEEATDNFSNDTNAFGAFEAGRRADEALGVFREFVSRNNRTLLLTTADSSAGSMSIRDWPLAKSVETISVNSGVDDVSARVPLDGVDGAGSLPFVSAPDKYGNSFPFAVVWAYTGDLAGGVLVRAEGFNAERVSRMGIVDNTDIYRLMYLTLFGRWLP